MTPCLATWLLEIEDMTGRKLTYCENQIEGCLAWRSAKNPGDTDLWKALSGSCGHDGLSLFKLYLMDFSPLERVREFALCWGRELRLYSRTDSDSSWWYQEVNRPLRVKYGCVPHKVRKNLMSPKFTPHHLINLSWPLLVMIGND